MRPRSPRESRIEHPKERDLRSEDLDVMGRDAGDREAGFFPKLWRAEEIELYAAVPQLVVHDLGKHPVQNVTM